MYLSTRVTLYIPSTHATFLLEQPRGIARGYQGCALARQLPRLPLPDFFSARIARDWAWGANWTSLLVVSQCSVLLYEQEIESVQLSSSQKSELLILVWQIKLHGY